MSPAPSDQFANAIRWAGIAVLAYLMYLVVEPFLIPLGWACVLAVLAYPLYARLAATIGAGRAAALTTILVAVVVIGPVVALTNAFARETVDIAQRLQGTFVDSRSEMVDRAWGTVTQWFPRLRLDIGATAASALRASAAFLAARSGSILANIATFFVDLALALFATFFLLRDGPYIMRAIRRLLPMEPASREAFITRTNDLIYAGVTSSVIVAGLQGLLGGLAFAVLGLTAPVFWGVVMAFACLLPFGAGVVWLPAAIYLIATGSVTKGVILIGLGAGVIGIVDNVVRPLLLSGRVQMNGLVIFVSLLGGLNVFGLLGIVLGPIVVVTALALVTSYIESRPAA